MAEDTRSAITPPGDVADRIVSPPSQAFVTGEDNLRVSSFNSKTGVTLTISGRLYDLETRETRPFVFEHVPNTDRTVKQTLHRLGKGYVLNAMVRATAGTTTFGQCYVSLEIVRGFTGATVVLGVLGTDYVSANQGIAWPGSPVKGPLEAQGNLRSITGSNPAAGAEFTETVPAGARWEVLVFHAQFNASAAVATRHPELTITDGTNELERVPSAAGITANGIARIAVTPTNGMQTSSAGANYVVPSFSPFLLTAGCQIKSTTLNIQAADQWASLQYLVRETIDV